MIDGRNLATLTGGIVRDPEVVNGKILKFDLAVDFAGSEGGASATGYFPVTYFFSGDSQRNVDFVKKQLDAGNLKKGSQVQIVGRLLQERWTTDEGNRSKVVFVAETINYAGSRPATEGGTAGSATTSSDIGEF